MSDNDKNGKLGEFQAQYEINSAKADRIARLILVGLAVEIVAVFILQKPLLEGSLTIAATALIWLGVWGELFFEKRAKEAGDRIVAEANARAAEANQKSAEVQMELAKIKAPRSLDGERYVAFVDRLRPFAGQAYDLSLPRMLEPGSGLHTQIMAALRDAGWKLQSVQGVPSKPLDPVAAFFAVKMPDNFSFADLPQIAVGISDGAIGILVGFDRGDRMEAHAALLGAFRGADIDALLNSMSPIIPGIIIPARDSPGVIHIMIGSKA
jgi:hypothetical protein